MSARDGGTFTAGAVCPRCGTGDVHSIRPPNPEAPDMVSVEELQAFGSPTVRRVPVFDRWDERHFETVRTCTSCKWEWGQR